MGISDLTMRQAFDRREKCRPNDFRGVDHSYAKDVRCTLGLRWSDPGGSLEFDDIIDVRFPRTKIHSSKNKSGRQRHNGFAFAE